MLTDGIIEKPKAACRGGPSRWIMANHYKEIDGFLKVDSIEEPLLFHEIDSLNNPGDIWAAGEIEKHPKCHDA